MSGHYFTTPEGPEVRRRVRLRLWDREVEVETSSGVFSADGLDLGTAVLLRESPPPGPGTRVLDLGCGIGPIALAIALAEPRVHVTAIDVNERALALARDNAARLGVADRVVVTRPEDVSDQAVFDEIWSNPPIRIGKPALHALLATWLPRLARGGRARLVVAKNLGADSLQRWLGEQGYACERLASAKGFRVFSVTRPDDA